MTQPRMDWDDAYRQGTPPPWSIGAPQPELARLIEQGKVRGEVLDAGCGYAALSLTLAAQGYTVIGLDASPTAVAAAAATADERGLTTASFAQADMTDFGGYDGRFDTVMDSGLLHALPIDARQAYVEAIHRASAPGAGLFILAFATRPFGDGAPGPNGFTADELRETVGTRWTVDEVRPAKLYANDNPAAGGPASQPGMERDGAGHITMPGFLLSAHKGADRPEGRD
ncbi:MULTISPECIES: class I SAM-dependent methyltransferase [unclassified Mycolicibacterium]|uniref:class I SAM-dependent methyltransferase n=1 Tax=unclassified Mycolicibacterium TaxID=2636767 RepID=UPI00130C3DDB|nr:MULTISPECIES: class I SAM-dependent methyltransferase [unclassified Mycolicibacterium]MUL81404.1 class I SAM-dependent methyltransferase [Mycolicibacterium sp. CBMA 329]MUL87170.1 class I SAM-dependent methyltransferase [Mycolicibacterium sp. CBMA 331]MUL98548.1 class I SAM-dependent methyltransferase [Mycolicibacterium sp. CBMA 334]MUM29621.1 class I SAM-dependent methyltransferase [Mycolicibacterium sp. CBMA 295]MUM37467.1 class I SAM-dependent methyltransferase [Mycolicibacterium sp. CBM